MQAFAQEGAPLIETTLLQNMERLAQEAKALAPDSTVNWQARAELRPGSGADDDVWLHLVAKTSVPLTCQRCMGEVTEAVEVDRHFLFVPDEATAAALDDESDDDVLAIAPDFNLQALIEDEVLMALPLVPRHEVCPDPVRLGAQTDDFDSAGEAKRQPFAALAALKSEKKSG